MLGSCVKMIFMFYSNSWKTYIRWEDKRSNHQGVLYLKACQHRSRENRFRKMEWWCGRFGSSLQTSSEVGAALDKPETVTHLVEIGDNRGNPKPLALGSLHTMCDKVYIPRKKTKLRRRILEECARREAPCSHAMHLIKSLNQIYNSHMLSACS